MNIEQINKLDENTKLTRELHAVIVGDPVYKRVGLVQKLEDMEAKLGKHEQKLWVFSGAISGMLFCWEIYKTIVHK